MASIQHQHQQQQKQQEEHRVIKQPNPILPTKDTTRPNELKIEIERAVALNTGETLHLDYRFDQKYDYFDNQGQSGKVCIRPIRAIQWNIERGIKLDSIIEILKQQDADIIALQEIDCGLSRSEYIETGIAIARELKLNYVFQSEFVELEGDIDKRFYYNKFKTSTTTPTSSTTTKSSTETTLERLSKMGDDMKNGDHNNTNDSNSNVMIKRDDDNYQKDYRKSSINISTTSSKHDPKIQFHPTPLPTTSTYKYLEQYGVESERPGVHGNCILTKFDISSVYSMSHQHHPYNWDTFGIALNEPRIGMRQTLCCVVNIPIQFVAQNIEIVGKDDGDDDDDHVGQRKDNNHDTIFHAGHINNPNNETIQLPVYTCHLELFCGVIDRLKIFGEIFAHFRKNFGDLQYQKFQQTYGLLLGDFNTLGHSIARFSPKYCKDELRWSSLGFTEAEWWYKYVLDTTQYRHLLPPSSQYFPPKTHKDQSTVSSYDDERNSYRQNYNYYHNVADFDISKAQSKTTTPLQDLNLSLLTKEDCLNLINPGFEEPFDPQLETLTNYSGWFYGKLDWVLTMGMHTVNTDVFNLDYLASDHRGLFIEFFLKSNPSLDQRFKSSLSQVFSQLHHHTNVDQVDKNNNNNNNVGKHQPHLPLKPFMPSYLENIFVPRVYVTYPAPSHDPDNYQPTGHRPSAMKHSRDDIGTTLSRSGKKVITQNDQSTRIPTSQQFTTSHVTELSDSTHVHKIEIFSRNGYYIMHPVVRDFTYGYFNTSDGLLGWIQRNYTPYLQNITAFIIPTFIAIFYVLFMMGEPTPDI